MEAQRGTHRVDLARRHGQGLHAQADKDERQERVAASLAAHADGLAGGFAAAAGLADHGQHGWLPRGKQVCKLALHTVCGHRVLRQVVGADGGEVDLFQHLPGADGRSGGLDHDTDLFQAGRSSALREPLGFVHGGDHGGHHPQLGVRHVCRCRCEGGELIGEQVLAGLGEAQAAAAQRGIFLLPKVREGQRLVGACVEGAHHHAAGAKRLQHLRVRLRLLLHRRRGLAVQEEELGAEQAGTLEVLRGRLLRIFCGADVGQKLDLRAVPGRALAGRSGQRSGAATGALLELFHVRGVGGDDDFAHAAVEGNLRRVHNRVGDALDLHRARDAQLRGKDRGVRGRAAGLGDNAQHQVLVQRRGLRRREVVRDQNGRGFQVRHPRLR